jgi:DNA polymerase-3 subunit alpha
MINLGKKEGIMVGPGRGSSAGSLLCYALGITDIDPIQAWTIVLPIY